ncbi:ATP-dependent DNA helicase DinG [Bacillus sp. CGMCC 1.16607]|uniref:ATP-dependent DNA helicase DinG n=1 Tax=Bacillus sp. CGMCC 1.16607 TaxID=3351842 RepID=UPI0036458328
MNNKYVVIDLETTGNSPKKGDRIIQFAAVIIENGQIVDTFSSLVNPNMPIPIFIEELTGINDDMVTHAPFFEELAPKIQILLKDAYFVAHNVLFDLSFLQEELVLANQEGFFGSVIDTVEMARFLYPTMDSYKLNDLAIQFGFEHDRPHQADSDALVTAKILLHFLNKMNQIPFPTCTQLSELAGGLKSDIQLLFEEMIEEKAREWKVLPHTLEIVNGLVLYKEMDEAKWKSTEIIQYPYPVSHNDKENQIKKAFSKYQRRKGQFQIMDHVYEAFINEHHSMLEAGTGIGKSLGYLLPAAYFSKHTKNKVLISTFTTQLQSQLIGNDLTLLKKMLPFDINIALYKGKTHYVSLSKFAESLRDHEDNYDSCLTKMQILIWLLETKTGDVDELNLSSGGQIFWKRIRHSKESDKGELAEKDFYLRAKKKVNQAELVITNHNMLLSDLSSQKHLLRKIDYIILDEGHQFHKVALKYFGAQLDYFTIRLQLNQFGLFDQKQLLYKLDHWLRKIDHISFPFEKMSKLITDLFFEMDEFFKAIRIFVKNTSSSEPTSKISHKIDRGSSHFKSLLHSSERFSFTLKDFIDTIQLGCDLMGDLKGLKESDQRLLDGITQGLEDLTRLRENITRIFLHPDEKDVSWIEIDFRAYQNSTTVYLQPVSISEQLNKQFFSDKKSVILTSATLTVNNGFDYILNEMGMEATTNTLTIPSPFDYKNKMKLFVPQDVPDIKKVSLENYVAAITEQIISIAEVTKGRMLILFTSHDMLRKTYNLMKESGLLEEYALIAQGISSGSRTRLTKNFQKFEKAILLGTSSFWEGIDIPGEDLSCLIMVRLPFTPPDDPFIQAKCEEVKALGGNPFLEVSLPEAVLRFKQGFGRLIRTDEDKGVLIVFDRRIIHTKYGSAFLKSIPDVPVKELSLNGILETMRRWL